MKTIKLTEEQISSLFCKGECIVGDLKIVALVDSDYGRALLKYSDSRIINMKVNITP